MNIESGPNGYEAPAERIVLPYEDEVLETAVLDEEGTRALYDTSPVLWVRAAIGAETGRGASHITNHELAERHSQGGFAEWDPKVALAVAQYLSDKGFMGLYGLQGE